MVVADSPLLREAYSGELLEAEGHSVLEASSVTEAAERANLGTAFILAKPGLAGGGIQELANRISRLVPIIGLGSTAQEVKELEQQNHPYAAFCLRHERESILESIGTLAGAVAEKDGTGQQPKLARWSGNRTSQGSSR